MHCEDTMFLNNSTKRPYNTVIDAASKEDRANSAINIVLKKVIDRKETKNC